MIIQPWKIVTLYLVFTTVTKVVNGCGGVTHMLISGRALDFYNNTDRFILNYRQILFKHRDALQAGSTFPDSFYSSPCFGGKYHDISEDTHWTPFLNASINYIRKRYPPPWDQATEKLLVFLLGVVSHQVADVVWHSLGITQGFLSTMANINFHGDFQSAHTFGDLGGEFVSMVDLGADVMIDFDKWYVPTTDLFNIYNELYGKNRISLFDIEVCSSQMLLESLAASLAKYEVYPGIIDRSPFLVQEMENYFLGGVNDMVGWTHRKWDNVITMLNHGTSVCNMTHSPLFVTCNKTQPLVNRKEETLKNGFYTKHDLHGLTVEDLSITKTHRGIKVQPRNNLKMLIDKKRIELNQMKQKLNHQMKPPEKNSNIPVTKYLVNSSYAKFGWSMSSGDIDGDGYQDIVIGSPGYSQVNNWQRGRVYIIYGNGSIVDITTVNLDNIQYQQINTTVIDGPNQIQSRFGTSVVLIDINLDGIDDLVIGSPAYYNSSPVDYNGLLSIYLGKIKNRRFTLPDIVVTCKVKYCNLGYTQTTADINLDSKPDLVIGAPFYTVDTGQEGMVAVLMASKTILSKRSFEFTELKWKLHALEQQSFAWFGHHMSSKQEKILISSPNYRKCYYYNCTYSVNDIQSVGRLDVISIGKYNFSLIGQSKYDSAGFSADVGYPYDNKSLVIAIGIPGRDVQGSVDGNKENIYRGGSVVLMNMTYLPFSTVSAFDSNRRYGRFGYDVKLTDLNGDGLDDLVISEPNGNKYPFKLENRKDGRLFVFYGGAHMMKGNGTFSPYCLEDFPCPSKLANFTSPSYNGQSHNGFKLHSVSIKDQAYLFSSDVTYDSGLFHPGTGRLSGVVYRYFFQHRT